MADKKYRTKDGTLIEETVGPNPPGQTTFVVSRGTVVTIGATTIEVPPGVTPADVTNPAEMRGALMEELKRLAGSASPTGNVLWRDDFKDGIGGWKSLWGSELVWSDEHSVSNNGSMKLMAVLPHPDYPTIAIKRSTVQTPGKYGLELWWVFKAWAEGYVNRFAIEWDIDVAGKRLWPGVQFRNYNQATGQWWKEWWYNAGPPSAKNFVAIPGQEGLPLPPWNMNWKYSWNYLKMVIDTANFRYDHLIVNGVKLDMSSLPIATEPSPSGIEGIMNPMIYIVGQAGVNRCWAFVDNVALTMEEP